MASTTNINELPMGGGDIKMMVTESVPLPQQQTTTQMTLDQTTIGKDHQENKGIKKPVESSH